MEYSELIGIYVSVIVIFSIPLYYLIQRYRRTKIIDYLLFSLFFGFILLSTLIEPLLQYYDWLILYQLRLGIHNIAWIFLLYHNQRLARKENNMGLIWYLGLVWFTFIEIMIIFWEPISQPNNIELTIFGNTLSYLPSVSLVFPDGAGLMIQDRLIFSSDFRIFAEVFWLYVAVNFLFTQIKITPANSTPRTIKAQRLWMIAFALFVSYYGVGIITLNHFLLPEIFIIISILIIGSIAVFLPEGLLLSYYIFTKIDNLIDVVNLLKFDESNLSKIDEELVQYLEILSTKLYDKD